MSENTKSHWGLSILSLVVLVGCDLGQAQNGPLAFKDNPRREDLICNKRNEFLGEYRFDFEYAATPDMRDRYVTPTEYVAESDWPNLEDDLDFTNMDIALDRQIQRFESMDMSGTIRLGDRSYPLERAYRSLIRFKGIVGEYKTCLKARGASCGAKLNTDIKNTFDLFRPKLNKGDPRFGESKPVLFTAYYTPSVEASASKTDIYKYAIYTTPLQSEKRSKTRVEIDFKNSLMNQNLELFYAKDLFDLYLMHVQGGGRIKLVGPSKYEHNYLSYAGTNGQPWNFISKYMIQKNMIKDQSIAAQRSYLARNKDKQEEIYSSCPSYVYFSETHNPPVGSDKVSLTDNRSIATDNRYYKFKGLLAFVVASRPTDTEPDDAIYMCGQAGVRPFSRFYIDQDTGGAIRGKGRVDLYFGEGRYAEKAAYNTVERGDLYFFMSKR